MARVRLGVVLVVPEPVGTEVDGLRRALGSGALGRIPPHVTLVPPVNVAEATLPAAIGVVRAAAAAARPLRLELGPPETFWPRNPVVYLAVGGEGITGVRRLREAVTAPPLDRPVAQAFVPHVTLRDNVEAELIPGALALLGAYRAEVTVNHVHLLRQGAGQVWETLAAVPLCAPAVIGRGGLALEVSETPALDAQAAVWAAAAWASYNREAYGEGAVGDSPFAFTARRDGRVVGIAEGCRSALGTTRPVAQLDRLVVDPAVRGEGIGSHLLAAVESMVAAAGCVAVRVQVPAGSPGQGFYTARGFSPTASLPAWRGGRDFTILERRLG